MENNEFNENNTVNELTENAESAVTPNDEAVPEVSKAPTAEKPEKLPKLKKWLKGLTNGEKSIKPFTAATAILLAVLITFMSTFVLLDSKYKADYNNFVAEMTGDDYYTLEYVKALFKEYYLGDISSLDNDDITDALIRMYIAQTGDEYAYYWNAEEYKAYIDELNGEGVGIGVLVNFLEEDNAVNILFVYPDSPAENAGLKPGDKIIKIEGESVAEMGYENALSKMKGEAGSKVSFTAIDVETEREKEVSALRGEFTTVSVISKMLSDGKTGYIRLLQFDGTTTEQFAAAYLELQNNGAEHFIFDVRDNPGGALDSVMGVLSFLVGDGVPLIEISDKKGSTYSENSSRELYCKDKISSGVSKDFKHTGKTVILTNKNTASAGELFTAFLHKYSADIITVGVKTYGKGVMQGTYSLPNGGALKLTYREYTAPGVENYDGEGLEPDVEQELSEEASKKNILSLTEAEDDQLRAALEVIYGTIID